MDKTFFEMIAHYRIEEAKRLIMKPGDDMHTILDILYEVGFNSKSTFNQNIKKLSFLL